MAIQETYIQNASDNKFYAVHFVTDPDGTIRLEWSDIGLTSAPPYTPVTGLPLITIPTYMVALRLTALGCTENEWTLAANGVSYAVEKYLGTEYRADSILLPDGLETVVANMIRMRLQVNTGARDLTKKSESITNYSYTNAGTMDMPTVLDLFKGELDTYRKGTQWISIQTTTTEEDD